MRFERLDLNLLPVLDALIEERSVSTAARRLFVSQPTMSGALNRLREFFRDDLLVQSGREMILTPKAEELRGPVREALTLIKARIMTPLLFDPATAVRQFNIVASDNAFNVLVSRVIAEAAQVAPGLTFRVEPTGPRAAERFERGEVGLMLTISAYVQEGRPHEPLYTDEHAVICWAQGAHKDDLTEEAFLSAGHFVAYFGRERHPAFTETYLADQGIKRKIEVSLPTFSSFPYAIIGTDRLATMYRRHAELFAGLPIVLHEPPIFLPTIQEEVQWHSKRSGDVGLSWLIELLRTHAKRISKPVGKADAFQEIA